ncbi:hypothetical protein D9M68_585620 [compost metagenome]
MLQRPTPHEFLLQDRRAQAVSVPGALHDRAARGCFPAHENRNADHPLVADDCDLGRGSVLHHIQQRNDRIGREIDRTKLIARLIHDMA